ncbi:MAG: DSD1 family PLP-dependent enzyme [Pirellulales bacterium]
MENVIGSPIEELDTPALLLDADAFDRNLQRMAARFADRTCQLRPHFKNHKCTRIARRQLEAGAAVGITCAKVGEAEVLAGAGFDNILIANQVVGARKLERLVRVAERAAVRIAADHEEQVVALSDAARHAAVEIGVLVEIDIGMGRCGLPPGEAVLMLAQRVAELPNIRFDGLQAYEGHVVYVEDRAERRRLTIEAVERAVETRQYIEQAGLPVGVLSGGSTSTHDVTGSIDGVDEIQCGTYATMDSVYRRLVPEFELAMTLLTRVISRPKPDVAVLDVGVKGCGHEFGDPQVKNDGSAVIPFFKAEEHCVVQNVPHWKLGQAVELVPSHACTTCNLHRVFHVVKNGRVIDVWPIDASGRLA